jgi:hypothetical protein
MVEAERVPETMEIFPILIRPVAVEVVIKLQAAIERSSSNIKLSMKWAKRHRTKELTFTENRELMLIN